MKKKLILSLLLSGLSIINAAERSTVDEFVINQQKKGKKVRLVHFSSIKEDVMNQFAPTLQEQELVSLQVSNSNIKLSIKSNNTYKRRFKILLLSLLAN